MCPDSTQSAGRTARCTSWSLFKALASVQCVFAFCFWSALARAQNGTDPDASGNPGQAVPLLNIQPRLVLSSAKVSFADPANFSGNRPSLRDRLRGFHSTLGRYPWRMNIVSTVFWIGERPTVNNPVPNDRSSWGRHWLWSYGGYDNPNPATRRNFIPAGFVLRQNPFYIALPYNDISGGHTKPEAAQVVPGSGKLSFETANRC